MKIFSSEFAHNYGTYSFGYCNYAVYENGDTLSDIYTKGYLPYSGSQDVTNTLYMARSTRIALPNWKPNSENRRVSKKYPQETITRTEYTKDAFEFTDEFYTFCLAYFERHHGKHTMPRKRLEHIVQESALTHVVEYKDGDTLMGYVFLAQDQQMLHVWFYFYTDELAKSSFGMWVMINEATVAQEKGKRYFYLGTAYGDKSRYKMNFSNIEFWDGEAWLQDTKNKEVKGRIKNDHLELVESTDSFKKGKDNYFALK